jgi:hypothetical protein
VISQLIQAPKTMLSSFLDLSAIGNQGGLSGVAYPGWMAGDLIRGPRATWSEKYYQEKQNALDSRPGAAYAREMGVRQRDLDSAVQGGREERYGAKFLENVPIYGPVVRATNRSYNLILNTRQAMLFDARLAQIDARGLTDEAREAAVHALVAEVNALVGRTKPDLGRLDKWVYTGLFSPQLQASRAALTYLIPKDMVTRPGDVGRLAARVLLANTALAMTTAFAVKQVAALYGAKATVELNPLSSNFLRIIVEHPGGRTVINLPGNIGGMIRFVAQFASGYAKDVETGRIVKRPRGATAEYFIRGRLNPWGTLAIEWEEGKTMSGEPLTVGNAAAGMVVSITAQTIKQESEIYGAWGATLGLLEALGIGVSEQPSKTPAAAPGARPPREPRPPANRPARAPRPPRPARQPR